MTKPYVSYNDFLINNYLNNHSSRVVIDRKNQSQYKASVVPERMTFGSLLLGEQSAAQTAVVTNMGKMPLPITGIVGAGDWILSTNCPAVLQPGQSCSVVAIFNPTRLGFATGGIYVNTEDAAGTEFVELVGNGIVSPITLSISDAVIGSTLVVTPPVVITPTGATYALTKNITSVNESTAIVFSLATTNVAVGTVIETNISGISASDYTRSRTSFVVGSFDTMSITLTADTITEGVENLVLTLVGITPTVSITASVNDTSTGTVVTPPTTATTYTLTKNVAVVNEGGSVTFTLTTTGVPTGTVINAVITGVSNADYTASRTSFVVGTNNSITYNLAPDLTTEGAETLTVNLAGIQPPVSSSVLINDTSTATGTIVIDPVIDYVANAFPGRRLAIIGDSISEYNHAQFPADPTTNRYAYYSNGFGGYWTYADQILQGRLTLEHGIQPDVTGLRLGYNLAAAGSKASEWDLPEVDYFGLKTIVGGMYAATENINNFDIVSMMGGTNDLSVIGTGLPVTILATIKEYVVRLASAGKWVFLQTIPPRSRELFHAKVVNGVFESTGGYTIVQQDLIRSRLLEVNEGLRTWCGAGQIPNVYFVDTFDSLVGPNGIDPAGSLSSTVRNVLDTDGNYRPDAPNSIFFHDGLHPGPAGAYVMGKLLAEKMIEAGVPARVSPTSFGPLTLGPNLIANPNMLMGSGPGGAVFLPTLSSHVDAKNHTYAGYATGLGASLTTPTGTGDNAGLMFNGYTHGKLPLNWHFYKCTNQANQNFINAYPTKSGGTFSNFMEYTFSFLDETLHPGARTALLPYMADSKWADGQVTVSVVSDSGVPSIKITFNIPPDPTNKSASFVLNTHINKDVHGFWDNYGFDTSPTFTIPSGANVTNPGYNAGDKLLAESTVRFENMVGKMHSCRQALHILAVKVSASSGQPVMDLSTTGATISGLAMAHQFWPVNDIATINIPTGNRTARIKSPIIAVPAYQTDEAIRFAQFKLEVGFDATDGVTGSMYISNPSVRKVISGIA